MKNLAKFLISSLAVTLILGATALSADEPMLISAPETDDAGVEVELDSEFEIDPDMQVKVETAPIFLSLELPEANGGIYVADFPIDGSATVADAVAYLLADHELEGLEEGYIASIDGIGSGIYGGYDGWLYAINYYVPNVNGQVERFLAIPTVGMDEYPLLTACQIVVYYGDFDSEFAGTAFTEDGMVKLVRYKPVYDENSALVAFEESPLAGGSISFTEQLTAEDGSVSYGETFVFDADENGVTELDGKLTALANGTYLGSVGLQETIVVDEVEISRPAVVRASDIYLIDVHPTEEELFREKLELLMVSMH